jgi:ApaG protein
MKGRRPKGAVGEPMYEAETRGVIVRAEPEYLEDQSDPPAGRYVWAYAIEIENAGPVTVQLISRYWRILDSLGRQQEVHGEGVVGLQPVIEPGQRFSYSSGCPLATPSGLMVGSYSMLSETGETFDIEIPAFSLDSPHEDRAVN